MLLSVNIIRFYLHDIDYEIRSRKNDSEKIHCIRLWERKTNAEEMNNLYISYEKDLPEKISELYEKHWFLIVGKEQVCDIMNRLFDMYSFISEWYKNMHVAALENKSIQTLIDLSEPVLKHPIIAFDAGFDVVAYTKNISCDYPVYTETITKGYTNAETMKKLKQKHVFSKIKTDELLIAPAADAADRLNIYLQFFCNQSLLGYTSIFLDGTTPSEGYLELVHMFMKNMSYCMKYQFEHQRHGQMIYETFLSNLIGNRMISQEQLEEQVSLIDGLEVTGRYILGVVQFSNQESVPLKFLARMVSQQFFDVKCFIYEDFLCLFRREKDPCSEILYSREEEKRLDYLLENYEYEIGVSRPITNIRQIADAYIQARTALRFGKADRSKNSVFYYKDYYYFHMFSALEKQMDVECLKSDFYVQLSSYDKACNTQYVNFLMNYFGNDCSAVRTSRELGIHRNTVTNMIHFIEEHFKRNICENNLKAAFIVSDYVRRYLQLKEKMQDVQNAQSYEDKYNSDMPYE